KVDDDQQVDQCDCREQSEDQLEIGVVHQGGLTMDFEFRTVRLLVFHAFGDRLHIRQYAAEVSSFCGDINVKERHDVTMRDDARCAFRREIGQIAEELDIIF